MNTTSNHKFAFLIIAVLLLISPATLLRAQDTKPLTELAQYFPAETYFYASFRTDDATISTLDGLYKRLFDTLALAVPPSSQFPLEGPADVYAILDQALQPATFAEVRPWLGDEMAVGAFDASWFIPVEGRTQFPRFALVARIKDRAAAIAFMQSRANAVFGEQQIGDFTAFSVFDSTFATPDFIPLILVNDSLLIITSLNDAALFTEPLPTPLSSHPPFTDTMRQLPASDYMVLQYMDYYQITGTALVLGSQPPTPVQQQLAEAGRDIAGQYAMGIAMLDGRALTFDLVWNVGDTQPLRDLGVTMNPVGTVDPAWLAYVPEDAALVAQSVGMVEMYRFIRDIILIGTEYDPATQQPRDNPMAYLESVVKGLTGTDMEEMLGLLSGQTVSYMQYTPPAAIDLNLLQQQMASTSMVGIADKARTETFLRDLEPILRVSGMAVSEENINGNFALVLRAPETIEGIESPEVVMLVTDEFLIQGTRASVETILNGNGNFQNNPDYQLAAQYMLPDAAMMTYIGRGTFLAYVDLFAGAAIMMPTMMAELNNQLEVSGATPMPFPTPDLPAIQTQRELAHQAITSLLHSISFTAGGTPEGAVRVRLVILFTQ
jgi:hypothetical protein